MSKNKRPEFHQLSERYLTETDLAYRKKLGQYFTPASIREYLLKQLPEMSSPKILDPACGSGEFLRTAADFYPDAQLCGWEIDPKLVKISRKLVPSAEIKKQDALTTECMSEFDFIIGNPPYFEFKPGKELKEKYCDVISGRTNIFSMFIKLGLDSLKTDGYLGFVIPTSMNNGAYFKKLREFIIERADIVHLKQIDSTAIFHNAQQQVMVLILKKRKNSGKYLYQKNMVSIFTPYPKKLQKAGSGKTTLFESGFDVKTGKIVWNKNKSILTNSENNSTLLIWAHNIEPNRLNLGNHKKPQYIKTNRFDVGPAIVVNRITGSTQHLNLRAAVVKKGVKFAAENHVNVIYPPTRIDGKPVTESLLKSIASQISSQKSAQFVRLITGNTQLSKTELWKLLPINI